MNYGTTKITFNVDFKSKVLLAECTSIRNSNGEDGWDYVYNAALSGCDILHEGGGFYWHACGY